MDSLNRGDQHVQWDTQSQSHVSGHCNEKIFVSVRLRPLNAKEISNNDFSDWECINNTTIVFKNCLGERSMYPNAYYFDRVFGGDCSTKEVYVEAAKEVALSVVNGINSSVFAYGQTSSGKTYTVSGITQYTIDDICDYIDQHQEREFTLKFAAMEIYNEAVRDLLSSDSIPLRLLDDPERGTVVEKLTEETLRDKGHLQELLAVCEAQRQIGETSLNETSSRSHQILRLTVESSVRQIVGAANSSTLAASVYFVDLAGSERASQAMSAGMRFKEGSHINRSLLTLGTVIRKLSKGRNGHIPYRDSKLTRILQNSLGGNAKTAIICTMSPAHSHLEQTRNTLLFGSCAKQVSTNAQVNVVMSDKELVKQLRKELARLEGELKYMSLISVKGDSSALLREKELQIEKMDREIKHLGQQRDLALSQIEELEQSGRQNQFARIQVQPYNLHEHRQKISLFEEYSSVVSDMSDYQRLDADLKRVESLNHPVHHNKIDLTNPKSNLLENPGQILSDETFPRFLSKPPEYYAPIPSKFFEQTIQKTDREDSEENCKEVCCIEVEAPKSNKKTESDPLENCSDDEKEKNHILDNPPGTGILEDSKEIIQSEDDSLPAGKAEMDPGHSPEEYDALVKRIRELQSTIDSLVSWNQEVENSLCSTESDISSCRGSNLSRSISCRAILMKSASSTWLDRSLHSVDIRLDGFQRQSSARPKNLPRPSSEMSGSNSGKSSTRHLNDNSIRSALIIKEMEEDSKTYDAWDNSSVHCNDTSVAIESIHKLEAEKPEFEMQVKYDLDAHSLLDIKVTEDKHKESTESVRDDALDSELEYEQSPSDCNQIQGLERNEDILGKNQSIRDDKTLELDVTKESTTKSPSNRLQDFKQKQRKVIELWDVCHTSLVHRSYFFLLFQGDDLSDSIYVEVEIRRLSFIQSQFSQNAKIRMDGQVLTRASSMRALSQEREIICKQMQRKFTSKERDALFRKWGIQLDSKRRKLQLAHRLWKDKNDMGHIQESATLIVKLAGLFDDGQVPKEMFVGPHFKPRTLNRRSYSWRGSLTPLV